MDKDTEIIVKDFNSILEELTFNSRPIITTLTKIAEENISCAQYFVDAIESRIEKCIPKQKLYAFYVLDSVCKNTGSPYTIYFSRNLFSLYKKTYLLVDNVTRTKMITLFKLWLTPNESIGGSAPLFEKNALDKIENFLIKASSLHKKNFESMLPTPTVPLLLREIDKLTAITNERLKDQPDDQKLQTKLLVLAQLKQELQKGKLTVEALKQVQLQLRQVFAQDQQVLQERSRQQQQGSTPQPNLSLPPGSTATSTNTTNSPTPNLLSMTGSNDPNNNNADSNSLPVPIPSESGLTSSLFGNISKIVAPKSFTDLQNTNKIARLEELYKSLNHVGLIFTPPKNSIVTLYDKLSEQNNKNGLNNELDGSSHNNNLPSIPLLQNVLNDCKAFFASSNVNILNTPTLQFNQSNITNENNQIVKNNLVHLLYRAKPNKCSTCGKRFGNSNEEKRSQSYHLDWHFRINKRIKGTTATSNTTGGATTTSTAKNIQSRNWYLHDTQWVKFNDDEIVSLKSSSNKQQDKFQKTTANIDIHSQANIPGENNGNTQLSNMVNLLNSNSTNNNGSSNAPYAFSSMGVSLGETDLEKKFVIVPESTQDMTFQCSICKESVNAIYDDDLGEWVWRNTMEVAGKKYHATCYYETMKNNNNAQ
ncbi:Pcf11p NDAI_0C04980 [Naumovozyma dairenensis CBS 421]|uniref:CID domain-containing protein n=1 Tax=Naumovozyma dairenensis (strain ATCC 10597 / BCRC 20456 / CBS 421 / NBRC 0211 / NRRL Y-12639) TaxID=1071378 RepID=G0W8P6_NAUDC|nr:hypothetical protein NDAI_0C04980 [Naumovozyma dairenensis CBS 421]CCD24157.1 hypothetical protein NDAI_0C04980 [Naumovozyma dairenensis CBS 421]